MLTAKDKDLVLGYIVNQENRHFFISIHEIQQQTGVSPDNIEMSIEQLERRGFISLVQTKDGGLITLEAEVYEFYDHGGFQAQEMIFKSQVNKLGLEIDKLSKELSPDVLDKIKNISDIASSVASVISVLPNK